MPTGPCSGHVTASEFAALVPNEKDHNLLLKVIFVNYIHFKERIYQ